ncbi:MAG: flagellar basal body L-ring protein FlgH [Spirochaetia bacterium]|nr:flagellar basal body L-ring protein FlgH [Spirochaetia bacterium]
MMKKILVMLAAVLSLLAANGIFADDIVNEDDIQPIFTDHKAYRVGDIVTVIVVESTEGSQTALLSTQKKQTMQGAMGTGVAGSNALSTAPSWGASGQETQDGGGKSIRKGTLVAKIAARVEKVLSNGNLVIKGTKVLQVNDEKQNLIIKGVIRAEDVASDNTIYSTNVADAIIEYEGSGPIGEKASPGIITRLLDWLGIF